jgi:uncharacterized membrane protein
MAGRFKLAFGGIVRSLHQLWLEVTGPFLLVFAGIFGFYGVNEFRKLPESAASMWEIVGAVILAFLTLSFGLQSFWKARKLR